MPKNKSYTVTFSIGISWLTWINVLSRLCSFEQVNLIDINVNVCYP